MLADACALASIGSCSLQPRLLAKGLQPFAAITALGMHISTTSTHAFWGGKSAEGAAKPGTKDAIVTTASGLQYVDHVVGTGDKPEAGWIVQVHYVGTLLASGAQFDSSRDPKRGPLEFAVGQGRVIQGWEEGIMSMRVGGKRRLIVPPQLGYGAKGAGNVIPPIVRVRAIHTPDDAATLEPAAATARQPHLEQILARDDDRLLRRGM